MHHRFNRAVPAWPHSQLVSYQPVRFSGDEITPRGNSRPCSRLTPKHLAWHPPTYSPQN